MKKIKVLSIFGTRPEAIKMCPLIREMNKYGEIENLVCLTGQHRQMLEQVIKIFGIKPDYDLDVMREKQSLTQITVSILLKLEKLFPQIAPDLVLVHGDTTTSAAAALAAYYRQIPVGHVEAGLRTYNIYAPFPEEINRKIISQIATLFFAPTENNKRNLEKENIADNIYVTGNTIIDSFKYTVQENYRFRNENLNKINFDKYKVILLTAHRRENWGAPLKNICKAVKRIVSENKNIHVIYPVHLNPEVRASVFPILENEERIYLTDPLDVDDMHNIIARSYLIMTDSGGLQEEGPYFGIPVVVLRKETERVEAVEAGTVKLAGICEEDIYSLVRELLNNEKEYGTMARAINPYGDGHASERITEEIIKWGSNLSNKTVV